MEDYTESASEMTQNEGNKQEQQLELNESTFDNDQQLVVAGIRLDVMQKLLKESFPKIETARDENIVMIIGNTGSGKSTTANYLLECRFAKKRNNFGIPYASPLGTVFAEMGEGFASKTFAPQAYKSDHGLVYCDFPGFMENRGKEEKICISINTQIAVNSAKSIKAIMAVIDFGSFTIDRGDSFKKLSGTLGYLLLHPEKLHSSIFFIVTKVPKKVTTQNILEIIAALIIEVEAKINALNNYMKSTWNYVSDKVKWKSTDRDDKAEEFIQLEATLKVLKLMLENSKNIILCNVFDNGQSRKNIIERLESSMSIDKNQFNFDRYDDDRIKFNHLVFKVAYEGTTVICKKIELPGHIQQCQSDIEETKKSIEFYDKQISTLKSDKASIDQEANINVLVTRIQELGQSAIKVKGDVSEVDKEIQNLKEELNQLNQAEPELYWQAQVYEERHSLGFFGWTLKEFSYNDIPYLNADARSENESSFVVKCEEPNQGKYEAVYKSRFYETGIASVKIYVERRNKPDSQKRIKAIREEVQNKKKQNEDMLKDCQTKVREIETLSQSVKLFQQTGQEYEENRKQQIEELEGGKRQLTLKISTLEDEIKKSKKELIQVEKVFNIKSSLYETITKIAATIDFNSSLVDEFMLQYTRLSSRSAMYSSSSENIPLEAMCSITQVVMDDPVTAACGHSFERVAIMKWIGDKDERNCPCCRKPIYKKNLISNITLKQLIDSLKNGTPTQVKDSPIVTSKVFTFFKGDTAPSYSSETLDALEVKKDSLEMEIDRLQRDHAKILNKIDTLNKLRSLIQSAKKTANTNNTITIVFEDRKLLKQAKNQLRELDIHLGILDNIRNIEIVGNKFDQEESINLTISQYNSLMGETSFKELSGKQEVSDKREEETDIVGDSQRFIKVQQI